MNASDGRRHRVCVYVCLMTADLRHKEPARDGQRPIGLLPAGLLDFRIHSYCEPGPSPRNARASAHFGRHSAKPMPIDQFVGRQTNKGRVCVRGGGNTTLNFSFLPTFKGEYVANEKRLACDLDQRSKLEASRMSSSSANRASALASAAMASARSSRAQARAPPQSSLALLKPEARSAWRTVNARTAKGKSRHVDESAGVMTAEEMEEYDVPDGLSARQRRLSRAARFGMDTNAAPVMLPDAWNDAISRMLEESDKKMLRHDYLRKERGESSKSMTPQRSSILHLTTSSPRRYASVRSVLRQIRERLGPDREDMRDNMLEGQWMPLRVVEYGCGAGEGLWATAEVFGEGNTDRLSYEGYDSRVPLVRVGTEIVDTAKMASSSTIQSGESESAEVNEAVSALSGMDIAFRTSRTSINLAKPDEGGASAPPDEPTEGDSTLVICNHALSNMGSDSARSEFVKALWRRHPSAEVIAIVEEANERGFACVASAREELLGIGQRSQAAQGTPAFAAGRHAFYEEQLDREAKSVPTDIQTCHVVAPCPHDRPCPLLHDYELQQPLGIRLGRSSQAPSPLFHGAPLGLPICSTPLRMHVPNYSRLTKHRGRAEESAQHCYVVVRRGERPGVNARAQQASADIHEAAALRRQIRQRAAKTKEGVLAELRSGSSTKMDVPIAEELPEGQTPSTAGLAASEGEDDKAREELLRLLPEILRQESGRDEGDGQGVPEAMRMAHEILEQSAEMAEQKAHENAMQAEPEVDAAEASLQLASTLLAQQRAMQDEEPEEELGQGELSKKDMEGMRLESYDWPRLVRPAIKRSGHVTVDACTAQGSIERFTLAKSMGKQVYQDARKASHGDLLPYVPVEEEPASLHETGMEDDMEEALDEDGIVQIQNVKSLITRVPAASLTERNVLPPSAKVKGTSKRGKMSAKQSFIAWPASSAMAIGPDMVTAHMPVSTSTSEVANVSFSRRNHYKSDQGRGPEQLQTARTRGAARDSRKRSLSHYTDEVFEGWTIDDEEHNVPGDDDPAQTS